MAFKTFYLDFLRFLRVIENFFAEIFKKFLDLQRFFRRCKIFQHLTKFLSNQAVFEIFKEFSKDLS